MDNRGISYLNENELYSVAELFKIFGNTSRIRILLALHEKETCVNCLAKELDMSESSVSHQLNILKAHRLIKRRREGKLIFYSLADKHVRLIIDTGLEHICEL